MPRQNNPHPHPVVALLLVMIAVFLVYYVMQK